MSLPLQGIRVLDLSRLLPGGFCSLLLADLGADVLKVEDTGMGDYIRWSPPFYEGAHESAKSALFLALNRNKRSIRLDLKNERGCEALLALVRCHDVVLESFRPGVLDRLGVGYERMREENPGIVYCAISGYGQDGPKRDASGHDMNYLGLVGLLGLTGERGGEPVQAAGQIADLGGGALMAAFAILAALRERDGAPQRPGSGEGQLVDVSMSDGALSWLALVAGAYFADGDVPRRGELPLAGSLICYRPYECSDGWVSLGALEPKFWQAWCRGVGHEELIAKQFERPGSEAHAQVREIFLARSREQWEAFAQRHDCCLEPVLELDEALSSELVARREMVVEISQPGVAAHRAPAGDSGQARAHAGRARAPCRGRRSASTPSRRCSPPASRRRRSRSCSRAARRPDRPSASRTRRCGSEGGRAMATSTATGAERANGASGELLKMSELSQRSGVSPGTIRYYLREGLLGDGADVVRTSRNMAYYPPRYVELITLIKRLQEERFMPLRVIKAALEEEPERVRALMELEDRILERALASAQDQARVSRRAVRERYGVPPNVLARLADIGVLTPGNRGYDRDDVKIIEAIASFRAGGYEETLGFTVYDTLRYREALEPLVKDEVRALLDRLAGEVQVERAMEIVAAGVEPLRELIGAMHSKMLLAELRRQRARSSG